MLSAVLLVSVVLAYFVTIHGAVDFDTNNQKSEPKLEPKLEEERYEYW